ncbi:putative insulin-like growth factor 2 antisense gene protein isoform X1 [Pongo pygmaeus]|uniref:putative insulin-like growth factor 2 antisense gene protein isoform X1 n=1 Tax=Pongo pygmaeus TaxID=9600 RepID=UPI0023E16DA8|nr:putative insulin-like growth factor 2 antisense gene protein [Pongo pygmaeus]
MNKRKWRGFRGAQPERARPPAASPQPCPAPHAGLPGGSRRPAPAPAGQQQMRAESRAGAQRRRGSARRGAHREAGGCVCGRTRSSGSGRSNALWRAVDAAEEVPSPKEPPLMLGNACLDFLRSDQGRLEAGAHAGHPGARKAHRLPSSQDQHRGSSSRLAPPPLLPAPGGRRRQGVDLALPPLAGEGHTRWRQPGWPGKSD